MLGEDTDAAAPVAAYPDARHGSGPVPSSARPPASAVAAPSSAPAPASTVAVPVQTPAPGRMLEEYRGAVSVTVYSDAFPVSASGDQSSSALPAPTSAAEHNSGGAVSVTACPEEVLQCSGDMSSSSVWTPSSAVAGPAPSLFENNDGTVSVTAYPEVFHDSGYNWSAAPAPPSTVAVPATSRMLEESNSAVSVTAYPEVFRSSGDDSSSVPAHSSAVAVLSPAPTPLAVLTPALAPGLMREGYLPTLAPTPSSVVAVLTPAPLPAPGLLLEGYVNNGPGPVTSYPEACYGSSKKPSFPHSAAASGRTLKDCAKEWAARKMASGAPQHHCVLPFLTGAPNAVECHACYRVVHPSEEIKCSVSRCEQPFHLTCVVEDTTNFTAESFKCPQHGCVVCKQKTFFWRCGRCTVAAHTKCAPWPVIHLKDDQGSAICWRHPSNWLLQNENADLTNNIEEAFCRLPLPYVSEEFNIDSTIRDFSAVVCKPPPYTHIRRNVYLVKKKRADSSADTGCRNCRADSVCRDDCECRGLSMSCSKNCRCSDLCSNKPFRKDKKFKIVKSEACGWGAVALEPLEKGDFIIEYVGEVINDATCEQRLWEMKRRGDKNFYMCEISKDCTIDATFKGNTSRFLNHSCDPNCKLEKWQVEGEIRVGVFASRNIEVGEPLTYDYRFVHFGEKVKCNCGAKSCQGYLGIQLKNPTQDALAAAAALENHGDCSPSRLKPETHLLPWTNCIEVPFNLRSKTKIDRLFWGRKRQRTSIVDPSTSSPIEAAGPVPNGFSAELV